MVGREAGVVATPELGLKVSLLFGKIFVENYEMKEIGPRGVLLDPIRTSSIARCVQRNHIIYSRQTQRGNLLMVSYDGRKPEIEKNANIDHLPPK